MVAILIIIDSDLGPWHFMTLILWEFCRCRFCRFDASPRPWTAEAGPLPWWTSSGFCSVCVRCWGQPSLQKDWLWEWLQVQSNYIDVASAICECNLWMAASCRRFGGGRHMSIKCQSRILCYVIMCKHSLWLSISQILFFAIDSFVIPLGPVHKLGLLLNEILIKPPELWTAEDFYADISICIWLKMLWNGRLQTAMKY